MEHNIVVPYKLCYSHNRIVSL